MITTARREMYSALKSLWSTSFGDDLAYAGQIIDNLPPDQILVSVDGHRILSMLCWLPISFGVPGGEPLPGAYMFGFNTHPSARSKGVGGELLREFHRHLFARGVQAIALAPAPTNRTLFDYYAKHDYETVFSIRQVEVTAAELNQTSNCVLISRALDTLPRYRDSFYADRFYGRWDATALRYLGAECTYRSGQVLRAVLPQGEGYLAMTPLGEGQVIVNEMAVPPNCFRDTLTALHQRVRAERYLVRLPVDYPVDHPCDDLPFVMVRWYDKEHQAVLPLRGTAAPYFGFILD